MQNYSFHLRKEFHSPRSLAAHKTLVQACFKYVNGQNAFLHLRIGFFRTCNEKRISEPMWASTEIPFLVQFTHKYKHKSRSFFAATQKEEPNYSCLPLASHLERLQEPEGQSDLNSWLVPVWWQTLLEISYHLWHHRVLQCTLSLTSPSIEVEWESNGKGERDGSGSLNASAAAAPAKSAMMNRKERTWEMKTGFSLNAATANSFNNSHSWIECSFFLSGLLAFSLSRCLFLLLCLWNSRAERWDFWWEETTKSAIAKHKKKM